MPHNEASLSLAHVYAHALYDVAAQQGHVQEAEEELLALEGMLHAEPRFQRFLETPTVPLPQKRMVVREILRSFHQPVVNFLCLLVDHQRLGLLKMIIDEYHELANMAQGIAELHMEAARALDPGELQQLTAVLAGQMRRRVVIRQRVRPELLGGFVLRRGDRQWDSSVSRRIHRLVRRMEANRREGAMLWQESGGTP